MTAPRALILMYHRVCERAADTACWFARGTAVTPLTFAAHLEGLADVVRFTTLDEAIAEVAAGEVAERPPCAITFDDGYRDVEHALRARVPVTVFPIEQVARTGTAPWFDRYYAMLHSASRRGPRAGTSIGLDDLAVPGIDTDLRWWVRGPLKERLDKLDAIVRDDELAKLEAELAAPSTDLASLYLDIPALRLLGLRGHQIGGHGATHERLDRLSAVELANELERSNALLDEVGQRAPRVFCYPNGAFDERVVRAVRGAGFSAACAVQEGVFTSAADRYAIPRFFMRGDGPPSVTNSVLA